MPNPKSESRIGEERVNPWDASQRQLGYDLHRICVDDHSVEYRYEYMTDLVTREAESIISSHDPERPLYLQLAHLAPHSSDAEEVMEVRDWRETNATLGHIRDVNRRKYASTFSARQCRSQQHTFGP